MRGKIGVGKRGEDIACAYLQAHGHQILERNYRVSHLEIDIISEDTSGIHFVEVKSRTAPFSQPPQYNVGFRKQQLLAMAALGWLNLRGKSLGGGSDASFDIVAVTFDGNRTEVEYFPQAFIPIYI